MRFYAVALLLLFAGPAAHAATLYSCPTNDNGSGDRVDRGFYVTNYPGTTLDTLTLLYVPASGVGDYTVSLTARLNTFDGPVLGATLTQIVDTAGGSTVWNFGGVAVPPGSTVTFSQVIDSGPVVSPFLWYDTGLAPCSDITQTDGTTPPLDTARRDTVGLEITGALAPQVNAAPLGGAGSAAPVPALPLFALVLLSSLMAVFGFAYHRRSR